MGHTSNLSWSFTRSKEFRGECRRKFLWDYYSEGEPKGHLVKFLKPLTTPHMLVGQVVDDLINEALCAFRFDGALPTDLPERGFKAFHRHAGRSQQTVENIRKNQGVPRGAKPLHSDFYGYDLGEGTLDSCAERVRDCLFNFEVSEVWETIKEVDPKDWCKPKRIGDINALSWQLGELQVWSSIDFYFRCDGCLYIIDWKSGRGTERARRESEDQIASYALWGHVVEEMDVHSVHTQAVFLQNEPMWDPTVVSASKVEEIRATILNEHAAERDLITLDGVGANGRPRYYAHAENFPPSPEVGRCRSCKYRKICPEGKAVVSSYVYDEVAIEAQIPVAA